MGRKLTTILAMDAVDYSRLMEIDEAGTLNVLKAIRSSIADPAIARHSGRTVKLMGDGTLAEFSGVVDASVRRGHSAERGPQ
jgi:class 3 adenylate cyclase